MLIQEKTKPIFWWNNLAILTPMAKPTLNKLRMTKLRCAAPGAWCAAGGAWKDCTIYPHCNTPKKITISHKVLILGTWTRQSFKGSKAKSMLPVHLINIRTHVKQINTRVCN